MVTRMRKTGTAIPAEFLTSTCRIYPIKNQKVSKTSFKTLKQRIHPTKIQFLSDLQCEDLAHIIDLSPIARKIVFSDIFDSIVDHSFVYPVHTVLEPVMCQVFHAKRCILWIDNQSSSMLTSASLNISIEYSGTLPGLVFKTQSVLQIKDQKRNQFSGYSDPLEVSPASPQLFIPLSFRGAARGVIQVIRAPGADFFTEIDVEAANVFISKFDIYGDSLITNASLSNQAEILFSTSKKTDPVDVMKKFFGCAQAEIWHLNTLRFTGQLYDPIRHEVIPYEKDEIGIVMHAAKTDNTVIAESPSDAPGFVQSIDGAVNGPILVVPKQYGRREAWVIALRGRDLPFNALDERRARALFPFIIGYVTGFTEKESKSSLPYHLADILEAVRTFSPSKSMDDLAKSVVATVPGLLECSSVLFYIYNREKNIVENPISNKTYSADSGVVGSMIQSKTMIFTDSDTEREVVTSEVDCDGVRVESILASLVLNEAGAILGVIVLHNKIGDEAFDTTDISVLETTCRFIAITMENIQRVERSIEFTNNILSISEHLINEKTLEETLRTIESLFVKVTQELGCIGLSLYTVNNVAENLELLLSVGHSTETPSYTKNVSQSIDNEQRFVTRIPMISPLDNLIGVLDVVQTRDQDQSPVFESLSRFLSLVLTNYKPNIIDAKAIMSKEEYGLYCTPNMLKLEGDESSAVFRISFNVNEWEGLGIMRVVFKIFSQLNLLAAFSIENNRLFTFLESLRQAHDTSGVFTWRKAVDSLQFLACLLSIGKFDRLLTPLETIGVVIACLSLNVKHDTTFETETRHVVVLEDILKKEECNILSNLDKEDLPIVWDIIVKGILSTDVSLHFQIIEETNNLAATGEYSPIELSEHRLILIKNLLRCSDFSYAARPFEVAERYFDTFGEEFFDRGDINRLNDIQYIGWPRVRENIDRERSRMAYLSFICLPQFQVTEKIAPSLGFLSRQISDNIAKWRKLGYGGGNILN